MVRDSARHEHAVARVIVLETLVRRWYAFAFVGGFFWAATAERDWRRALRFLATAAFVSLAAEYASTHTGFPYGRYEYVAPTRGDELYVSNVPLFVPVSFGVVVWAGRSLARAGLRLRGSMALVAGTALMAAGVDAVIDPMTLRGRTWFLGPLYGYESSGAWFGVPWSNFAGWALVSAVIVWIDELFEAERPPVVDVVRGPTLALGICAFFVAIAVATTHSTIALAGAAITLALGVLAWAGTRAARRQPAG